MKQGWMQTLGGLAILLLVPVLTVLCLSPDVHDWLWASLAAHSRPKTPPGKTEDGRASEVAKQYQLPNSILKIAEVSEAEPNSPKTPPSDVSRAVLRLQSALEAYPSRNTQDVFRAVNGREESATTAPCPFERINGEQSVVLAEGRHGHVSLTETLNQCAAAVEQVTDRGHGFSTRRNPPVRQ